MKFNKKKFIKSSIFFILLLSFLCLIIYNFSDKCIEGFTLDIENDTDITERSEKYEKLMKDFNIIFSDDLFKIFPLKKVCLLSFLQLLSIRSDINNKILIN